MAQRTMEEMIDTVVGFCRDRDWDPYHGLKDLSIGISTEAGELLGLFRFKNDDECKALLESVKGRADISDELADVFFFVLRFAYVADIDLSDALASKMEKNALKYPVDKARGSNRKYTEL